MNTQYFYIFCNFTFVSPGQLGQKNGHRQLWSVQFLLKIYFLYNLFSTSSLIHYILFVTSNICSNKYYISILSGTHFLSLFPVLSAYISDVNRETGYRPKRARAERRKHSEVCQDFVGPRLPGWLLLISESQWNLLFFWICAIEFYKFINKYDST